VLGEHIGPAADLYALGMTLYTLFIKDRFPLILRGAPRGVSQPDPVDEAEVPALSSATTVGSWSIACGYEASGHGLATIPKAQSPSFSSLDFIIGVKVRFRSQLARVLEGVQHAGWVGDVLRLVRTATQIEPRERFKSCEEFAAAICDLVQRLPK
jgi:hypothetical protein